MDTAKDMDALVTDYNESTDRIEYLATVLLLSIIACAYAAILCSVYV